MFPRQYFDSFWRPDMREEAFVAMSFDAAHSDTWTNIIRPAILDAGLNPHRVDNTNISGDILTEIMDGIAHARLVVADLSTANDNEKPNPNVMYEVGLAHALRQDTEVLLIRGNKSQRLFDVGAIRVFDYDRTQPDEARIIIGGLVQGALAEIETVKGLRVEVAIASLDDTSHTILAHNAHGDWFQFNEETEDFTGFNILRALPHRIAINRLLELGIISYLKAEGQRPDAFVFTDFGRTVQRRLHYL